MDLLNLKVRHKVFGSGIVTDVNGEYLTVQFESKEAKFVYTGIKNPIKTIEFKDDIIRLCQVKYAPFDKDGNGNMGYLFDINRELAKIFIKASVKQNKYLADIDYIVELLSEE